MFCPLIKEECRPDCALKRKGMRYMDDKSGPPIPFEMCVFNLLADCGENMVQRSIGMQQELNLVRDSSQKLMNLFAVIIQQSKKLIQEK